MLILDGDAVREAFPMSDAVEVMRSTMRAYGDGDVFQPPRTVLDPPQLEGFAFLKPAAVGGDSASFGLKVITFSPNNPTKRGLPAISGFVALFDVDTGVPAAILDGGVVTEIRTGAVSGVATDILALPGANDLALIGAGVQARSHLLAMAAVRKLTRVRVWSRSESSAALFAEWASRESFEVECCPSVEDAVRNADIICTVSSSTDPLVDGDWVVPGAHVNAVGAWQPHTRELQTNLVQRARVVVDSREETRKAAGDLLIASAEAAISSNLDYPELGELLAGKAPGRTSSQEITVFESLGLAIEDIAAAARVVAVAREQGLGVDVPI